MTRLSKCLSLVTVLCGLFAATAVVGEERSDPAAEPSSVLGDVMHMLEEGVGSPVIMDWLDKETRHVPALSPDDVIGLTRAGAGEKLIERLIEMSAREQRSSPPPPPPVPAAAAEPPGAPADGESGVAFSFVYRSQSDDSTDEMGKRWAMFAYLDGELLTWSRSSGSFSLKSFNRNLRISPGTHVIRLVRESHKSRGKRGWEHESLVSPDPVVFELEPGEGWHLSISWVEPAFSLKDKRPLSWQLTRWDAEIAGIEKTGVLARDFRQLCEDMEANIPEGKKAPGWVKRKLEGCVRWSSLWTDEVPLRAELLETLEQDEFRPSRD